MVDQLVEMWDPSKEKRWAERLACCWAPTTEMTRAAWMVLQWELKTGQWTAVMLDECWAAM